MQKIGVGFFLDASGRYMCLIVVCISKKYAFYAIIKESKSLILYATETQGFPGVCGTPD